MTTVGADRSPSQAMQSLGGVPSPGLAGDKAYLWSNATISLSLPWYVHKRRHFGQQYHWVYPGHSRSEVAMMRGRYPMFGGRYK